jgi:hypothetical protein
MELKTLKDLRLKGNSREYDLWSEDLKAEAVNDIRFIERAKGMFKGIKLRKEFRDVIEYIKWKNNLTEEDLKGGKN